MRKWCFLYNGTLHSQEFTLQATIEVYYPIQFSLRNKPQLIRIFRLFPRYAMLMSLTLNSFIDFHSDFEMNFI